MTTPSAQASAGDTAVIAAAVAVATLFFAEAAPDGGWLLDRDMACYVLDGHLEAWAGWDRLPAEHQRRMARLLRYRDNQFANAHVARSLLDRLLDGGHLPGCAPAADYADSHRVHVAPGMPLPDFADTCLDQLAALQDSDRRVRPTAGPGQYRTTVRVPGPGRMTTHTSVRYEVRDHHAAMEESPPAILDATPLPALAVPYAELAEIAAKLDAVSSEDYRTTAVSRFRSQARPTDDALSLAAGPINELLAYTGFGKSVVLIETFACWAASKDIVVTFSVPTNADVVRSAYQIERALRLLKIDVAVTPLMSPNSLIRVAEATAGRTTPRGPDADWIWSRLGYGCALAAAATTDEQVDAWQPGQEPCAALRPAETRRGRNARPLACPWRGSCGKFALARAACTAGIIVTSHANLLTGRVHAPVDDGQGDTERVTVEELVLRRSHVVVIDEIDSFQRSALEQAGRGLLLDRAGSTETPLRRLDTEFSAAFGQVHEDVDASVRNACSATRFLAENYVSHLSYGRLGTAAPDTRRAPGPSRRWVIPRRWDSWLAARLFGLDNDDEVPDDQRVMFESLFAGGPRPLPDEPAVFGQVRPLLRAVITSGPDGRPITAVRPRLDHLLRETVTSERDRVVNRLLRRAILEQVRTHLYELMLTAPQLAAAGVESAQEITDTLGPYRQWRVTPNGPLGRLVFAFTEHHDETGDEPTRLMTAAFGGDPHVYTVRLGDTTALAVAGTRRIVLGLSATAFFPGAPHYHVHARPRWWVRDDNPGTVTIRPAPVGIQVSGREDPARADAIRQLARQLWPRYLDAELQRLDREDHDRSRVLLATTSYDGARQAAEGLSAAGVPAHRICLAVRPRDDESLPDGQVAAQTGYWWELPADRLEDFPAVPRADILIAPLARVQRGVNIIGAGDKSALGSVWLLVRPIPVIDEPAELIAHLQAHALGEHPGPAEEPLPLLRARRKAAGLYFEAIVRRPPYFQAQPPQVRLGVTAEIINNAIQLIGRARRGGTPAVLHLVDEAFHDGQTATDFPSLITRLRAHWSDAGVLEEMRKFYGTTLEAFFDYARENASTPQSTAVTTGAASC